VRGDVPENSSVATRNVAVECHFENGVLTSFRWIAGPFRSAPPNPAAPNPAPPSSATPGPAKTNPAKTDQAH
jgi:hypothetical protein